MLLPVFWKTAKFSYCANGPIWLTSKVALVLPPSASASLPPEKATTVPPIIEPACRVRLLVPPPLKVMASARRRAVAAQPAA